MTEPSRTGRRGTEGPTRRTATQAETNLYHEGTVTVPVPGRNAQSGVGVNVGT